MRLNQLLFWRYAPVATSEDQEELGLENEDTSMEKRKFLEETLVDQAKPGTKRSTRKFTLLNAVLLCLNLILATTLLSTSKKRIISGSYSFQYDYAPLSSIVEMRPIYRTLQIGDRTPYTAAPSDEVDAAWDQISAPPGNTGMIGVDQSDLVSLNMSGISVRNSSETYGIVKVFHDLHCLNMLRKQFYNASYYHISVDKFPIQEEHVAHCLDSLRESLMCRPNLSLHTFKYVRGWPTTFADFRHTETCANFDEIRVWAEDHKFREIENGGSRLDPHPEAAELAEKRRKKGTLSLIKLIADRVRWYDVTGGRLSGKFEDEVQ